jgi:hypothetical protein
MSIASNRNTLTSTAHIEHELPSCKRVAVARVSTRLTEVDAPASSAISSIAATLGIGSSRGTATIDSPPVQPLRTSA